MGLDLGDVPEGRLHRLELDHGSAAEDEQALQHVDQLAYVARPPVVSEPVLRTHGQAAIGQVLAGDEHVDVVRHDLGDVLAMVTKRRHRERNDVEHVVEIIPQL